MIVIRTTSNLGLRVWDNPSDQFSPTDLAFNWDKLDSDYGRARPANQAETLSTVPSSGNFDGRLVYLTASDQGFPAKTLIRYNGSSWATVGPFEIQSSVPTLGNYAGRMVLLSAAASGFPAWSLIRYDGSAWGQAINGVDVSATVPASNNYAGRVVVLSTTTGGFNAWDMIRYDGSAWTKIGPQAIPPATELAYYSQPTDITTTNTASPGDGIQTFSAATFENVKYYFHIVIPKLTLSVAGNVNFLLRESTTIQGNPIQATVTTGGAYKDFTVLFPFTPTAGSHTYNVTWYISTAGTATINTTSLAPAIFRIIKA